MNDNRSRDIFYGVVAVATLIVAIVGATLAYFSISVSSGEGAVSARSKVVSINYNDKQQVTAQAKELIPSELKIMQYFYELQLASGEFAATEGVHEVNKCQDVNNQEICSVYRFSVSIDSGSENITAMLRTEDNDFNYLSYAVRDVTCTPKKTVVATGDSITSYEKFSTDEDYTSCWVDLEENENSKSIDRCSNNIENDALECYAESAGTKTYSTLSPNAMNSIFGYDEENNAKLLEISGTAKVYDIVLFLEENRNEQNEDQGKEYKGTIVVEVAGKDTIITGRTATE